MINELYLTDRKIEYDLQYKKVKNINLRIKPNGNICVSANKSVPKKFIDDFLMSKEKFIINALEKYDNKTRQPKKEYFSEDELKAFIIKTCEKIYPYFEKKGVKYPQIKFKKMTSRWGSCHTVKYILTFNTNLIYAESKCVEYVILHEFTHFLQANHSKMFYAELSKICPKWKDLRKKLKEIQI